MNISRETCPLCTGDVINKNTIMEASRRDQSGKRMAREYLLECWCPQCAIFLTRRITGMEDSGWVTSFVEENTLTGIVPEQDIMTLLKSHLQEKDENERLKKFLSMKTKDDTLWQFSMTDNGYHIAGLVLKRGSHLVGEFRYLVEEV